MNYFIFKFYINMYIYIKFLKIMNFCLFNFMNKIFLYILDKLILIILMKIIYMFNKYFSRYLGLKI